MKQSRNHLFPELRGIGESVIEVRLPRGEAGWKMVNSSRRNLCSILERMVAATQVRFSDRV